MANTMSLCYGRAMSLEDLGIIGNIQFSALVERTGIWALARVAASRGWM